MGDPQRYATLFRVRKAFLMLACVALLAGCGSQDVCGGPSKSAVDKALAGSPAPLASLHAQANRLLSGGAAAFDARMRSLEGHPVVVNSWGSWCAPCRGEFKLFQQAAVQLGKNVAFLGLDAQDNNDNARKFLACRPVSYPSYEDGDVKISFKHRAGNAFPTTIFYNPRGQLVYAHPGQYTKLADLVTDIRRYTR
jgi:thiol-disulfide isomerase/thioredoxin